MINKFINREKELAFLESEYNSNQSSLVVIYGRRRIGKTSLIKKFIQDKSALYFLASEEPEKQNIKNFQNQLSDYTSNILLKKGSDFSWEDLFNVFSGQSSTQKKILVIDEFQYLGKTNPSFPSIFQRIWDEILKDANVMVILCGSLIQMMESQTLNYSSPLYGRRTGQIKMKQISFIHYWEFYNKKTIEELVQYYAVTGGVPKYIEVFHDSSDIYEAINKNILSKQSFLYEEPIFLLQKEVSEIGSYFAIIKTIAQGNHKLGHISAALGIGQTGLTKYLNTLINLDLIERQVPITEKNPEKSKKGLYYIKDNFIEFWFKFIYPYRSYLELDNTEYVMTKLRNNFIDNHVSFVYEKVCAEKLWQMNRENKLFFNFLKLGKWWNNTEEIDIAAINEDSREILLCECKYQNKPVDVDVLFKLEERAKLIDWERQGRKDYFIIFSKSGFTDILLSFASEREDLMLLS